MPYLSVTASATNLTQNPDKHRFQHIDFKAEGGDLNLGWTVIGERGPELVYNDGQRQHVLSNAKSMSTVAAKSGSGLSRGGDAGGSGGLSDEDRARAFVTCLGGTP